MHNIGEETGSGDHDDGSRESTNRNRDVIANNLHLFKTCYWSLYQEYGFTFAEGYRAWLLEFYLDGHNTARADDDDDEPWRG